MNHGNISRPLGIAVYSVFLRIYEAMLVGCWTRYWIPPVSCVKIMGNGLRSSYLKSFVKFVEREDGG